MATKLDKILEWVESLLQTKAGVSDVAVQQPVDQPQQNTVSVETDPVVDEQVDNTEVEESIESQPEVQQEAPVEQDNFEEEFAQLVNMFSNQETQTNAEQTQPVEEETKIDFSGSNTPDKDYQKLYEEELQKRMDFEWEKRDLSWQVNYLKSSLDKEGEKYWELMDKFKSMENELRTVSSRTIPENFVPLAQTYNLWQETNIPAHKWRAVKEALTIVENMTWVPASEYYNQIIQAENHDIPEVNDTSSTISKVWNNDKKSPWWFILL